MGQERGACSVHGTRQTATPHSAAEGNEAVTAGPRRVSCQPLAEVAAAFRRCLWFVGRKKTQQDFFTGKATWASKSRSGASGLGGMHFPGTPVATSSRGNILLRSPRLHFFG